MARSFAKSWLTSLSLGAALTACYSHHTVDEEFEPVTSRDGGLDCDKLDDDDVEGQIACDPDMNADAGVKDGGVSDAGTGGRDGGTSDAGAGGRDAGTGGNSTNPCANPADFVTQIFCGLTGGQTGGGQTGGGQTGGGANDGGLGGLIDLVTGLLGGNGQGGIDLGTLLDLLGALGGTGGNSGGFLGGGNDTGGFLGGLGGGTTAGSGGFLGGGFPGGSTGGGGNNNR